MRRLALALLLTTAAASLHAQAPYHRFRPRPPHRSASSSASHRGTPRGHRTPR